LIEARLVEEETTAEEPSPATTEHSHDNLPVVEAMPVALAMVYIDEYNNNREWRGRRKSNRQRLLVMVIVVLLGIIGLGLGLWLYDESGEVPTASANNTTFIATNETEESTKEIDDEREFPKL
jgi:hypothetical protein